jgi:ADP-ribose pyrophosphatase YjhB (NUDIX family)/mannose-6-phosphate isomerase-like protein (cupin superfamily)
MTAPGADGLEEVAGGVVVAPDGRFLVVSQCGTSWSLPKGHLEPGETALDGARREIHEESGLSDLALLAHLTVYERSAVAADGSIDEGRRKRITLFGLRASTDRLAPQDDQNPEARWVRLDELISMLTHPADSAALVQVRPTLARMALQTRSGTIAHELRGLWPQMPAAVCERYLQVLVTPLEELKPQSALVLDKPYGINVIIGDEADFGISVARLHPGRSSSFHYHDARREFFTVRAGDLTVDRGQRTEQVPLFRSSSSVPGMPHAIRNDGDVDLEIAEIFSPYLLDDKTRITDRYDRRLGRVHYHE